MASAQRLSLPIKGTVSQLCGIIKGQPAAAWCELLGAWERLSDYLSLAGLQHSPVFFAPNKPHVCQAHLVIRSQYLLQTDAPAFGVAPRSRDGKGRRLTAAQSAEQALSHKLLALLDPDGRPGRSAALAAAAAGDGPRSLPLPAEPSPEYSSYKDELYAHCRRLDVPMPLFYSYAVTDRPKSCMAVVSCAALTRCEGQVVMRGLRSNSLDETLLDLAEVALYAFKKVRLEELVAASQTGGRRRSATGKPV